MAFVIKISLRLSFSITVMKSFYYNIACTNKDVYKKRIVMKKSYENKGDNLVSCALCYCMHYQQKHENNLIAYLGTDSVLAWDMLN